MCRHTILVEPGFCPDCDSRWNLYKMDSRSNFRQALKVKEAVWRWLNCHPGSTAQDLYTGLEIPDITMYIALHMLVHDRRLSGPDPYAPGAGNFHTDWTYKAISPWNEMEIAATWGD